ncbi:MAG: integration host factor subunit alpha [Betaproteobacteria bacterium HGW-Betaproteobacteria-16]|nr:MAG: integration host factor subunit alpha [Betaproteobacteria bacterium HGW-Betaproteobacteria-16]
MNHLTDNLALSSLTKADLADLLGEKMGVSGRESDEMVNAFFELILEQLAQGEKVKLTGFGSFVVQKKSARMGRNPRTGLSAPISPRQVVKFSTGPTLRERMMTKRGDESEGEGRELKQFVFHPIAYALLPQEQAEASSSACRGGIARNTHSG